MGENLSEACVSPGIVDASTLQTAAAPNQTPAAWQYNYNMYQMAAAAATYQQQQAQQYNAYRAHVQQYAMQQMNNQQAKPNNAPPGFSNAVIPPPPPTLMDIDLDGVRPQQQNQKQFGGIRFNLTNQQKRLQNSPLNAAPQTVNQQMQNNNGNAKKKRKRNKNKQQQQQQQQQSTNFQTSNNSLAASPSLPDMSIPPPVILSSPNAKQAAAFAEPPPSLHTSNYSSQSQQSPVQTQSSTHNFHSQSQANSITTPTQNPSPIKKSEPFHNPADAWPDSLNNYVARCYAKCKTNFDKDQIDICLKGRITAAANRGELWTKDWDAEPTPSVYSERNNIVPKLKAPVPGQLSNFQNAAASVQSSKKGISQSLGQRLGNRANGKRTSRSRSRSPYTASSHNNRKRHSRSSSRSSSNSGGPRRKNRRSSSATSSDDNYKSLSTVRPSKAKMSSRLGAVHISASHTATNANNNKKNKNKKNKNKKMFPDLIRGDIVSDAERLQQRAARFTDTKKHTTSAPMANGKRKHGKQHRLFVDDNEGNLDLIDFHIVGTCRDLEKSFLRLTKAPAASEVRPADVLVFSLGNVKAKWTEKKDYFYACDQLKSIRQDLTVSCRALDAIEMDRI